MVWCPVPGSCTPPAPRPAPSAPAWPPMHWRTRRPMPGPGVSRPPPVATRQVHEPDQLTRHHGNARPGAGLPGPGGKARSRCTPPSPGCSTAVRPRRSAAMTCTASPSRCRFTRWQTPETAKYSVACDHQKLMDGGLPSARYGNTLLRAGRRIAAAPAFRDRAQQGIGEAGHALHASCQRPRARGRRR